MHGIVRVVVDQTPVLNIDILPYSVLKVLIDPLADPVKVADQDGFESNPIVASSDVACTFKDDTLGVVPDWCVHRGDRRALRKLRGGVIVGDRSQYAIRSNVEAGVV